MYISERIKCRVNFFIYTKSCPDAASLEASVRRQFDLTHGFMQIIGRLKFEKITACAFKVSFLEENLVTVEDTAIIRQIQNIMRNAHPDIRKVENISVNPWSDEEIMLMDATRYCKECGSELTIRRGIRGQYYGCTNFPNCIYREEF